MYGAILGDMIGCPFESEETTKSKEFPFFSKWSFFTDDTILTVEIADALASVGEEATIEQIERSCAASMQKWGNQYNVLLQNIKINGFIR